VRRYLAVLRLAGFRRLWLGATASTVGDGMTTIALVWLVYSRTGSATAVGWLVFAYGAPVIVGGLLTGPWIDRFGAARVMRVDALARAAIVGSVPLVALAGEVPLWIPFVVAASYGFAKMVPLAGVPTLLPELVPDDRLDTANALESVSYGLGSAVAPALAGVLVAAVGAAPVLALDAISFLALAWALVPLRDRPCEAGERARFADGVRLITRTPALWVTTGMFAAFNVGAGILLVLLPLYADEVLGGGAAEYGLLFGAFTLGELVGATAIGALDWRLELGRSILVFQTLACAALALLIAEPPFALAALALALGGAFSAPMTVLAQTLRMRLIPAHLRGRVFALLRTTMQAAAPAGGALGGALIAFGGLTLAAAAMAAAMGVPALLAAPTSALASGSSGIGDS
jgi:MFS family permease